MWDFSPTREVFFFVFSVTYMISSLIAYDHAHRKRDTRISDGMSDSFFSYSESFSPGSGGGAHNGIGARSQIMTRNNYGWDDWDFG